MELIKALISVSYPGTNGSHLCIKHIAPIQFPHSIKLEEDELVGTFISEMALIDEDGDVVAFSNFLAKGKDETEVTFTIEDNY